MTIELIAISFSATVLLWLVGETIKSRDNSLKTNQALFGIPGGQPGLIARVDELIHAIYGMPGEIEPSGLVARMAQISATLTVHCNDERLVWDQVKQERERLRVEVRDTATAVLSEAQVHMETSMNTRLDAMVMGVKALTAQHRKAKGKSTK